MGNNLHINSPLVIRADASVRMGTGHIMRCLALAQTWQDCGGTVVFAVAELPTILEQRLQEESIQIVYLEVEAGSQADAVATAKLATDLGSSWVIVDGYQFEAGYQYWLKDRGVFVLVLDDYGHVDFYKGDIVLNQNISVQVDWYRHRSPQTRLLLGTQYVLLRQEFRAWQTWVREIPTVASKLLVTLGGSDPDNVTAQVLTALKDVPYPLTVDVIIGGSNPHYQMLSHLATEVPYTLHLHRNVQDVTEHMATADIAISAAGSTCWELAYMQMPTMVLILAKNQVGVAESLGKLESVLDLGWYHQLSAETLVAALTSLRFDAEKRAKLAQIGRNLVDGQGTIRVIEAMVQIMD